MEKSPFDKGKEAGLLGVPPDTSGLTYGFWEYLKGYSEGAEERKRSQLDLFSNPKKEEK